MRRAVLTMLWAGVMACSTSDGIVGGAGATQDGLTLEDGPGGSNGDAVNPGDPDATTDTATEGDPGSGTTDAVEPESDVVVGEDGSEPPPPDAFQPPDEGPPNDAWKPGDDAPPPDEGPPPMDIEIPPTNCWVPELPEEGVTMDCGQICSAVSDCGVQGAADCPQVCATLKSYVAAGIDAGIQQCIVAGGCSYPNAYQVFTDCGDSEAASGNWEIPPTNASACSDIEARLKECGKTSFGFSMLCPTYAKMFNAEAMDKIDACKLAPCSDVLACVGMANCGVQQVLDQGGGPPGGDVGQTDAFGGGDGGGPPFKDDGESGDDGFFMKDGFGGGDFGGPPKDGGGPPFGDDGFGMKDGFGGGDFGGPPGDGGVWGFDGGGDFGGPPGDGGGPPFGDDGFGMPKDGGGPGGG